MMGLTVAQRGVGFLRTALFCRLLPEQELGQWSLVFSFVMLCAPMTLLGITGSFGRYVEHYLQRGLVRRFFRRTGLVVGVLTCSVLFAMWCATDWVSWCLFGSVAQRDLLVPALLTLASTILYNYFLEVVIALRHIRIGSIMELISSWVFASLSILLLMFTNLGSYGVVLGFAVGNLAGAMFAFFYVRRLWGKLPVADVEFTHLSLWKKVAPFAIGLWMVNLVANLFDMVDRYMIVHFSNFPAEAAQGLVGQYFSSMAVPLLMVGLSTTLAHLVMPYLSEDWEAGRFEAVSDRVSMSTKLIGMMLVLGSTVVLLISPWLFDVVFGGKYDAGLAVLPITIAFCFWKSVAVCCYNYLFCVEKTRLMSVSLVVGLVLNIALNAVLLPIYGLPGAAIATAAGCGINVVTVLIFSVRNGYRFDPGICWVVLFPFVFIFGSLASSFATAALLIIAARTDWFLRSQERDQLNEILHGVVQKVVPQRMGWAAEQARA